MSSLIAYPNHHVVWVPKMLNNQTIEAHYAGFAHQCNRFVQKTKVPPGALIVKPDLSGIADSTIATSTNSGGDDSAYCSWRITNNIQNAVVSGLPLPLGSIQLDPFQEEVARCKPPLIIESRSGTGKTLILLQHAAYHSGHKDPRPACFVTVPSRLKNDLVQRYEEINRLEDHKLPPTQFFTFQELLRDLCDFGDVDDFKEKNRCNYLGFERCKKAYSSCRIEPQLIESEIGGVIVVSYLTWSICLLYLLQVDLTPFL